MNTPLNKGDKVYLTAYDKEVRVVDALSSQFTCYVNKSIRFFFYSDKGDTWKQLSQ